MQLCLSTPSPSPSRILGLRRRPKYSVRPFYISIFLLCVIAVSVLVLNGNSPRGQRQWRRQVDSQLPGRRGLECRLVNTVPDQCAYIQEYCIDEQAGLFSYLQLYYCTPSHVKPIAFTILVLWMGLLFSTIGIAASDFFCVNLSTIATILGMGESMAGVTLLAFGNGSPDVFSTFAAMSTHSGSLAIGELIGAAGFITAVVAGSMALVRPFRVARKVFIRDVTFFIAAVGFSMVFLADGYLTLWECVCMVVFYVFYVCTVMVMHWIMGRRKKRKEREALARGQYMAPEDISIVAVEDTHDEDPIIRNRNSIAGHSVVNFSALERAGSFGHSSEDEDDEDSRDRWVAEINRNMRVNRPAPGEWRITGNPIRPSLVGALEFRAVLSSLEKSRNQLSIPISLRRYSDDPNFTLARQQHNSPSASSDQEADPPLKYTDDIESNGPGQSRHNGDNSWSRDRAVSADDAIALPPPSIHLSDELFGPTPRTAAFRIPRIDLSGATPRTGGFHIPPHYIAEESDIAAELVEHSAPNRPRSALAFDRGADDNNPHAHNALQVPSLNLLELPPDSSASISKSQRTTHSQRLNAEMPLLSPPRRSSRRYSQNSANLSPGSTSPAMPFPPYLDDPNFVMSSSRPSSILPPLRSLNSGSFLDDANNRPHPKPIHWWPYHLLPPPSVLASTLFPTLYSWSDKNAIEKIFGVIAAPSVFLLAITLPIVEIDKEDDETDSRLRQSRSHFKVSATVPSTVQAVGRYRDSPPEEGVRDLETAPTSALHSIMGGEVLMEPETIGVPDTRPQTNRQTSHLSDSSIISPSDPVSGWNRWLVSTQVFTAPFFVVLIFWANTDSTLSARNLMIPAAYTLIGSLVVFAFILLTTNDTERPRFRYALCFLGFIVSIAWISTIANEVVGVLKAFGVISGISDAILGLTIFAVGNSLGDLVADITVARLGFPVMALSACFGGPMLNILLGVGLSGLYMTIRDGVGNHKPYPIEVGGTLIISAITLLITLVGLLAIVPLNKWVMDKKIGWGLMMLWCISTVGNVVVEVVEWDLRSPDVA